MDEKSDNELYWWTLTNDNLEMVQRVIKITLNFLQLHHVNRLTSQISIPLKKFEDEKVYFDDVVGVLSKIDGVSDVKDIPSSVYQNEVDSDVVFPNSVTVRDLNDYRTKSEREKELRNKVFIEINSLDDFYRDLYRVKDLVDKKLNITAPSDVYSADEKFELDIRRVIQKIRETDLYFHTNDGLVSYNFPISSWYDEKIIDYRILEVLQDRGVITGLIESGSSAHFRIVQPQFDKFYRDTVKPQPDNQATEKAIEKKLYVLEKLKEEYDLAPKKSGAVVETHISTQRLTQYENECGVDYNQLKNILQSFQEEGLIESFNLYNPGR